MKIFLTFILLLPNIALAQGAIMDNLNEATESSYKQDVPLMQVIGNIIKILLMLLGTLFVILLLLGGFRWMTAQGDAKKVEEARDLIKNSVVGVVIILAAYAIAAFVLKEAYKATTVNNTPAL